MVPSSFLGERPRLMSAPSAASTSGGRAATLHVSAGGESRIGKLPLPIPKGVTVTLTGQHLAVKVRRRGRFVARSPRLPSPLRASRR